MIKNRNLKEAQLIVFDIGNTLINANNIIQLSAEFASNEFKSRGYIADSSILLKSYLTSSKSNNHKHINRIFSDSIIIEDAMNKASLSINEHLVLLYLTLFRKQLRSLITPNEYLIWFLSKLKKEKIFLAALSDGTTIEQYELLERMEILNLFDYILVSESFGEEKISTKIFNAILQHFSIPPHQAAVVGDDLNRDIYWGFKTGLITVLQNEFVKYPIESINKFNAYIEYKINNFNELFELLFGKK